MARFRPSAIKPSALAAVLLLVAGCTTPSEPPVNSGAPAPVTGTTPATATATPTRATPPKEVPKPAPVVEAKPASITGSEESSTMFDNFTAYVAAIDGQSVAAGRTGWNTPLTIKAGPRRLTIAFIRGVFTAQTIVQLDARPEAAYQLKFATDAQIFGKSSYCEFWIEDKASGEKALAPTRVPLTKLEAGQPH